MKPRNTGFLRRIVIYFNEAGAMKPRNTGCRFKLLYHFLGFNEAGAMKPRNTVQHQTPCFD